MSVPETIKQKKPSVFGSVEIRSLHGRYYCYVVSYQRPPNGGPSKKITGQCVGQITESEGFVPNANGLRILAAMPDMYSVYTYGAYEALSILSAQMEALIRRLYSSAFPSLKTYSLIDAVNGVSSPPLVDYYYRNSFLSIQYPGLIFSATSVDQIRSFKMPSDGRPVVHYMKKAYLEALKEKTEDAGETNLGSVDRMVDVLNTIYRIRAPMLNCYLLSPISGIAARLLNAIDLTFDNKIFL